MKYQGLAIFIVSVCVGLTFAADKLLDEDVDIGESEHLFRRGIMNNPFYKNPHQLEESEEEADEDKDGVQKRDVVETTPTGDLSEEGEVANIHDANLKPGNNGEFSDETNVKRKQKGSVDRVAKRRMKTTSGSSDCFCPCLPHRKGYTFGRNNNRVNNRITNGKGQRPSKDMNGGAAENVD